MGETVCTASASPVIGNEDRVGSNSLHHHGLNRQVVAAGGDRHPVAVFDAMLFGQTRMNLCPWFRILIYQCTDAPRLCP